jgi:hypothetical protein
LERSITYRRAIVADGDRRNLPSTLTATPGRQLALAVGAGIATSALIVGSWIALKVLRRGVRTARGATRFAFATATLRLFRRCPDCKRLIRADARVCRHCGYRRPPRGRRARRRARREAGRQAATPA